MSNKKHLPLTNSQLTAAASQHTSAGGRAVTGVTAGKLSRFYAEHSTPAAKSGRSSPSSAAALTADTLATHRSKTGLDALHHFARHGLDTTPKLVHCLPATAATQAAGTAATDSFSTAKQEAAADAVRDTQGPYDLTVVPRTQLPASYFTVSATGVVEVPGDSTPSVYTPIGQWLRQSSMHELLASLPAGQHMLQGSILRSWQASAQQQRFQQRRQQLGQQLLLLKPSFHRVLAEARARLAQLQAEGPLATMDEGVFKLESLISTQQEYQQSKVATLLSRVIAGITADVLQLAGRLQGSERLLRREVEEYRKDPSAGASKGLCSIKIKAERAAVIDKHNTAVHDLQRLPCFLNLLAQIILQAQLDLLVSAVSGLKQHLQGPGNTLQVQLLLQGPGGAHMGPGQDETLKGLSKGVLEHLVGILIAAPRLLKHPSIAALLADPVHAMVSNSSNRSSIGPGGGSAGGEGGTGVHKGPAVISGKALRASNDAAAQAAAAATLSAWQLSEGDGQEGWREGGQLLMMVVGDKNLQSCRRTLDQHVMRSYREAQQVADALSDLGVLLRFACMWDPKAYKARQRTVAGLRRDMLLIREWQAQLQVVLGSQCVGMLRLETGALKATYANTLSSAQATIAMLMAVAGRRAAEAAVDKLQTVSSQLTQQPSKLPEFIAFRLAVRAIRQQQDYLLVALPAQVADLYNSVTSWGFRLPNTDQGLLEDLREACRGCSTALTAAVAFLDSRHLGMVALLDRQARDLLRQVQALLKRLEDAAMAQRLGLASAASSTAGSDTHGGLAGLSGWQAEIDQLGQSAAVVNEQEQRLDMRCTHFGDLEDAQRVLQEMQQHAEQPAGEAEACHA